MRKKRLLILHFLLIFPFYCWANPDSVMVDSIKHLNKIGVDYFFAGDYEKAEAVFIKILNKKKEIYPKNHTEIANAYNNLGVLYKNKWQYKLALDFLNRAKSIYESHKDNITLIANVYSNIGNVFHHEGDYLHAEEYYNKSLEIIEGEKSSLAIQRRVEVLNRYSLLEIERQNYSSATTLIKLALNEYINSEDRINVIMHDLLINASTIYNLNNKPDSSLLFIKQSINLIKNDEHFSKHLRAESYRKLSEYFLEFKQLGNALEVINSTEIIFSHSSIDSVFYFETVKLYAKYYELNGEYKNAIIHYNEANQLLLQKKNHTQTHEYISVIKGIALLRNKSNCLINWYYADLKEEHLVDALIDLKTITILIDKARSGYLSIESKLLLAENPASDGPTSRVAPRTRAPTGSS